MDQEVDLNRTFQKSQVFRVGATPVRIDAAILWWKQRSHLNHDLIQDLLTHPSVNSLAARVQAKRTTDSDVKGRAPKPGKVALPILVPPVNHGLNRRFRLQCQQNNTWLSLPQTTVRAARPLRRDNEDVPGADPGDCPLQRGPVKFAALDRDSIKRVKKPSHPGAIQAFCGEEPADGSWLEAGMQNGDFEHIHMVCNKDQRTALRHTFQLGIIDAADRACQNIKEFQCERLASAHHISRGGLTTSSAWASLQHCLCFLQVIDSDDEIHISSQIE